MAAETGKRVTAADVARSLGISRATVGFVLNNTPGQTISAGTRERVLAEAARLGYRPHRAAQTLRRGSSKLVLLVLPDWPIESSMRRYLEEAELTLDEAGYSLVTHTRHAAGRARPLWELLAPDVVVGLVPFDQADIASMRACGITRIVPDPARRTPLGELPAVTVGTVRQVEYLYELGHRRLGYAASADPRVSALVRERGHAAERTAARLGVRLDVRPVDHRDGSAERVVRRWRKTRVTGVVAYNDDVAAMVAGAAVRMGLLVPGDLAIIGHDDSPYAAMFVPSLSSVRVDVAEFGRYLLDVVRNEPPGVPPDPAVTATVVTRESTSEPEPR